VAILNEALPQAEAARDRVEDAVALLRAAISEWADTAQRVTGLLVHIDGEPFVRAPPPGGSTCQRRCGRRRARRGRFLDK
jgi:hypothetical protein